MKRLFDMACQNAECEWINDIHEMFIDTNKQLPACKCCGIPMDKVYTKTPSFEINGGGVYKSGKSYSI